VALWVLFLSYFWSAEPEIMVFVNEYYVTSAFVGGIILGAGFIMGGFSPEPESALLFHGR